MQRLNFYDILKTEVNTYYEHITEESKIYNDMLLISDIYNISSSNNYEEMYGIMLAFKDTLKKILKLNANDDNYLDQLYYNIYTLMCYENNPEKYDEKYIGKVKNKFDKFRESIKDAYEEQKQNWLNLKQLKESKETIKKYREIMDNVREGKEILAYQYKTLKELYKQKGFDETTIILLLEQVRNHNVYVNLPEDNKFIDYHKKYQVINMLSSGYEKIEEIYYDGNRKKELDNLYSSLIQLGSVSSEENIIDFLPSYNDNLKFSNNIELIEFEYLLNKLLLFYQKQIFDDVADLKNIENYTDKEMRYLLVNDYYNQLKTYKAVRTYEQEQLELYNNELSNRNTEEEVNHLEYFCSSPESEKSYFENDLKSIAKDLYLLINDLIVKFKNGDKTLNTRYFIDHKSIIEIKNDQIRIVLKVGSNNTYGVIGVYQKKDTNDRTLVDSVDNRNKVDTINTKEYEQYLNDLLTNNFQKGGRRNTEVK